MISSEKSIVKNSYPAASKMTGKDKMNENFVASRRRMPSIKPAVIVIPDLDVPGINAKA